MAKKILNHINTYADLTAYNNDMEKDFPNISYIQASDEVKWVKDDPTLIIATYNVGTTSNYKLLHNVTNIEKMWIDGVEQPSVVTSYMFATTGEHIVKYKLTDNTTIGNYTFYNLKTNGIYGITSIIIPSNVTTIGQGSFVDNEHLESMTILATTPPTLYDEVSIYANDNFRIYVPSASLNTYKAAQNYSRVASRIQAIPTT